MAAVLAKNQDSEVHITYEDQQQINTFARYNARLNDLKDELETKKKDLQNLEDAGDELMMAEDETALIPYQIGEVFVMSSQEDVSGMLERTKEEVSVAITETEAKCEQHKQVLSDLKVKLYAKFGNNINLEADEE